VKLIHKKEFLKLKHEVVFHYYGGCFPEDLNIFIEPCGERDFIYQGLIGALESMSDDHDLDMISCAEEDSSFDIPVDYECASRDGYFEDTDKYYVLTKNDLHKLIQRLTVVYDQMPDEAKEEYKFNVEQSN
jgi:hypothetical protein